MGNSSSKSDKKQKKEEPTAAVEDVPVKQEERFFTRTLSEQSDWDLRRPPMACAAVCPDYLDTSDTIEITASPIISHVPETVTTTAVTPTPPLIEEPLNPDTDSDDSEEVIEPPRRPQMACSSAQPQYIIEKPRPAFLEEPTSLTEPPKPPELPMPSLIPQHIDENPPVIEEPTPIDKPLRARPRMACSSINPKYLNKKPQKEEKKKVPITTIADYVPDLSITALLARPQMACSSINPAYLNKINEKKEVIIPVPTAPITTTLQEEDTEPLINSPVERPEMACYTVCPDYLDNSSDEEAYNLLCDSPKAPSSPKPSPLELINLSIDLFPVVKHLFRFLEAIDEVPRDPIKNLMAFALHRYNKWLDFINWCIETGQDDVDHRPPFDIEVVWVAHVIRTDEYKADCLRLFGREIPHVFDHKSGAHTSVSETTRKLWKERTGSDLVMNTEKFFNLASVFASNLASGTISDQNKTSITVCILIEDMKWFHDFRDFYPRSLVSLLSNTPSSIASSSSASEEEEEIQQNLKREFGAKETPLDLEISESDKTFLEEAHRDYLRFLALQKKYNFTRGVSREEGAGSICATYKIDLFWHSHMLNTREYRRDCESYLGDIVPHAPWPTEAVDIQHHKFNFTGDLWQKEFGDEFQATKP